MARPIAASAAATVSDVNWVPAGLPPVPTRENAGLGAYLTPEQGRAVLAAALARFPDQASWDAYAAHARRRIQEGAGLARSVPGWRLPDLATVPGATHANHALGRELRGHANHKVVVPIAIHVTHCERTRIVPAHAVADDVESERRVGYKAVLVVVPFEPGIRFGAMRLFECQTTPPLRCETL